MVSNWRSYKKELLNSPEVKAEYDQLEPEYAIVRQLLQARIDQKMTQQELAEKVGVKQPFIARIESGETNLTLATLRKISTALGKELVVNIC